MPNRDKPTSSGGGRFPSQFAELRRDLDELRVEIAQVRKLAEKSIEAHRLHAEVCEGITEALKD